MTKKTKPAPVPAAPVVRRVYIAGPMSGFAQFNFPAFYETAEALRACGYDVVSPAELDDKEAAEAAMASKDGNPAHAARSWGDFLARDVKLLADDGIQAIFFLPGWEKSKGAKLEAFVGVLCGLTFATVEVVHDEVIVTYRATGWVLNQIAAQYKEEMTMHLPLVGNPPPVGTGA